MMLTISSKASVGKPSVTLFKSSPLTPIEKARAVRKARYQDHARKALTVIREARLAGYRNAHEFMTYMNAAGFPAPNGGPWNETSVLRILKTLKKLGIDNGSKSPHDARKIWAFGKKPTDYAPLNTKLAAYCAAQSEEPAQMQLTAVLTGVSVKDENAAAQSANVTLV
jgi:hypothetical protein